MRVRVIVLDTELVRACCWKIIMDIQRSHGRGLKKFFCTTSITTAINCAQTMFAQWQRRCVLRGANDERRTTSTGRLIYSFRLSINFPVSTETFLVLSARSSDTGAFRVHHLAIRRAEFTAPSSCSVFQPFRRAHVISNFQSNRFNRFAERPTIMCVGFRCCDFLTGYPAVATIRI